jgi:hypothetical protein
MSYTPMGPSKIGVSDSIKERLVITNAYTNSTQNSVFLDTYSVESNTIHILSGMIKDSNGNVVAIDEGVNTTIINNQHVTIRINYNITLTGIYTINLVTSTGRSFGSPPFNVSSPKQ